MRKRIFRVRSTELKYQNLMYVLSLDDLNHRTKLF